MVRSRVDVCPQLIGLVGVDAHRPLDRRRVAPLAFAPLVQHGVLVRPAFRRPERVPRIRVASDEAQGDLLARTADEDRKAADGRRRELGDAVAHALKVGFEGVETPARRAELEPVLGVVTLEPSGADAEDRSSVRDVVDRAVHIGHQLGVAVRGAPDHEPERGVRCGRSHRSEECCALEVRAVRRSVQRVEVIPHPDAVGAECVRRGPCRPELGERAVLRMELNADLDAPGHVRTPCGVVVRTAR